MPRFLPRPGQKTGSMASGNNRGQKMYLLASPQYVSVPDPRQNVENNRGRKPFLHWCAQISLKNKLSLVKTFHIGLGNMSRNVKGISLCIKTWQSWLFIPYIFPSSRLMQRDKLDEYPSRNFSCFIHSHTFFLWSKFKTYVVIY